MATKRGIALATAVLLAALLFGCSTKAPAGINLAEKNLEMPAATAAPAQPGDDSGFTAGEMPVIDPGQAALAGKKIIYNADIVIEAQSATTAADRIIEKTTELGGYLADSYVMAENRTSESYITVRMPPEKLKEFTTYVGTLGKAISTRVGSQDVTDQYYDVQSRLTNAQAQEVQLLEIMKQAYKVEDILAVRRELNSVQQEIEQLKGQMRLMDNQVGFATVRIFIRQPAPPAVVVEEEPDSGVQFWGTAAVWQKIARGVSDSFNWTLNAISGLFIALSYVIVPLLLIAVVVVAIILIVKAAMKARKKQGKQ